MSATKTFRLLATKTELADSPFPADARYQPVVSADGSPEALAGGMGVVYHAQDTLLGVDVAIKRMQRNLLGDPAAEKRFIQEARTQIRLSHPHIVRMYTINEDSHGPWMVLEWVDGQTLQALSEIGERPAREEAVQWVLQIAAALHFAHVRGFVHRDVKPGNILLRTADRQPLLTDFGLVVDKRALHGNSSISLPGVVLGTIDFMAPEQAHGSADLDHRADQWALGAVLAWLLTGKTMRVLRQENLPQHLREVVLKATEEDPQDRFRDLAEFAETLKTAATGPAAEPSRTRPATTDVAQTASPDAIAASGAPGKCWQCGHSNPEDAEFCVGCGKSIRDLCLNPACRHSIGVWQRFCAKCGTDQPRQREERQQQVIDRCHVILGLLEQQRYDLALAELQQLESQNATDRLRLLLGPAAGLRAEAERVRNDVQRVIDAALEAGTACNYAEALQSLGQIPKDLWPVEADKWQRAAAELQELTRQIPRLATQGAFLEYKAGFQRLQELKPGPWSDRRLLEKCLAALITNAGKLHAAGQLEQAVALLEVVPPGEQTPAFSELLERVKGELAEQLKLQLKQSGDAVSLESLIAILEKLNRLQPGKWRPEDRVRDWLRSKEEQAQALWKQRQPGEVFALLQEIPQSQQTPAMRKRLAAITKQAARIIDEAASLAATADYTAAVQCLERLPENLRPAIYAEYAEKQRQNVVPPVPARWPRWLAFAVVLPGVCWIAVVVQELGRRSDGEQQTLAQETAQERPDLPAPTPSQSPPPDPPPPQPATRPDLLRAPFSPAEATAAQTAWAGYLKREVQWQDTFGQELVLIPPGSFLMGSPEGDKDRENDEGPQHPVEITEPFYIGRTEVTQGQWKAVMGTEPWKGQAFVKEGDQHAASYISQHDATEFCRRLSQQEGQTCRLPTEAEWEYVCRAGTTTRFSFGDDESLAGEYAWFDGNAYDSGEKYAHSVRQKKPNGFGLYDMHGNVWEWCEDWYENGYGASSPLTDPRGPNLGSFRVLRGGSWLSGPIDLRSSGRYYFNPEIRGSFIGCRVLYECG